MSEIEIHQRKLDFSNPGVSAARTALGYQVELRSKRPKADLLANLQGRCIQCRKCRLRETCSGVVFGEGNPYADLMLIGEAPGAVEDQLGRPFVGPAGALLDRILAAAGFARDEVYITNANKCRPPGNRLPSSDEVKACFPWLKEQIELIRPRIIVCLGAHASQSLISDKLRITRDRGHWFERDGIKIMPTFHPAALLRDPDKKRPVWEDFKAVRVLYDSICMEAREQV